MIDYSLKDITPKLKGKLKESGRRMLFTIIDECDNKYTCFNRYLYEGIVEGEPVKVRITSGKFTVITDIIGYRPDYPVNAQKPPANKAELEFFNLMKDKDWELTNKGWPDFACMKNGRLVLIEVKPKRSHRLKLWQHRILLEFVKHGIQCYRWSPDGGFQPIISSVSSPINMP